MIDRSIEETPDGIHVDAIGISRVHRLSIYTRKSEHFIIFNLVFF